MKTVDNLRKDVTGAKSHLEEIAERSARQLEEEDERRDNLKDMGEAITKLKSDVDTMQEKRKCVCSMTTADLVESFGERMASWRSRCPTRRASWTLLSDHCRA